ncbi:MAG TPA: N-6 DNA methylase [Candidatus Kapabacteria bacterium]
MSAPLTPLESIDLLVKNKIIPVGPLDDQEMFALAYGPVREYIDNLRNATKPETATHDLFRDLIRDVLKVDVGHEVSVERGAVDYMLRQENANPIAFELKPLFYFDKDRLTLDADPIIWKNHTIQIQKYLKSNEYVILTDLRNAYLFNRMALIDYKPFETIAFTDLVNRFATSENMWDSLRRIEDQTVKVDLDKSFFEDLKKWYDALDKVAITVEDGFTKKELIVLLLNKIIFIKTLEDYGLVNFRHLLDEYDRNKDRWNSKGSIRILEHFFKEIEEFFYEYYNTELFEVPFWKYVVKTDKNAQLLLSTFEQVIGTDNWARTYSQGMVHYNYRQIDEDIFGKAYETFIAEEKKDEGIYYTPKSITAYMAKKLVEQLFGNGVSAVIAALDKDNIKFDEAHRIMRQIESIKIIDPTSGSGSFLIKVLREIYAQYQRIVEATDWVSRTEKDELFYGDKAPANYRQTVAFRNEFLLRPNQRIQHIARLILLHIYAVDKDERALDTAKANMWKEAIKLNPKVYNYRKLNEISHILPNLELNFVKGDSLAEVPFEAQVKTLSPFKTELAELHRLREAYLSDPFNPELVQPAVELRQKLAVALDTAHPEPKRQLFLCLEFFHVFFDKDGSPLDNSQWGFDGAISNPPWEALKPVRKEYANIAKGSRDVVNFSEWFKNELERDASFKQGWEEYKRHYAEYSNFLRSRYTHQGKGDPNYYKYFLERDIEIVKQNGAVAILIQSGFQTDVGCKDLRDFILRENSLDEISSFENKGYEFEFDGEIKRTKLFPDVHPQFKFSILLIEKQKSDVEAKFKGRFYLHHPDDLYNVQPIPYSPLELERFSPINFAIMEFRSERDREICERIRNEHPILKDLGYRFYTEMHMTNDSGLFIRANTKTAEKPDSLPVFEGKMIHQYRSNYDVPRFFINRKKGEEQIRRKIESHFNSQVTESTDFKIDTHEIRLGIRAVARSTDERTIIASLLPENTFVGNSVICVQNFHYKVSNGRVKESLIPRDELFYLLAILNSLTLNYYIRNKISANVSISFLYEMPVPKAKAALKTRIVELSRQLLLASDTKGYFSELGKVKKIDPISARAELEVLIARDLYGLDVKDWEDLTSTFTYGSDSTREELDSIIAASRKLFA